MTDVKKDRNSAVNTATGTNKTTPRQQMELWAEAVWGETPAEGQITLNYQKPGGRFVTERFPSGDCTALLDRAEQLTAQGADIWAGCGVIDASVTKGRGGKADVRHLRALWVDVDVAGDGHKGTGLPTDAAAWQFITRLSENVPPQMVVASGGGYHVYTLIEDGFDPQSPDGAETVRLWYELVKRVSAETGVAVDEGVSRDVARVLRLPGTLNHKTDPPQACTIYELTDHRMSHERVLGLLRKDAAKHPAPEPEPRKPRRTAGGGGGAPSAADDSWAWEADPEPLLTDCLGWDDVGMGRFLYPGSTSGSSAEVKEGDAGWDVFVNSETIVRDWGIDHMRGEGGGVRLHTPAIIQHALLGGDRELTNALLARFEPDADALVSFCVGSLSEDPDANSAVVNALLGTTAAERELSDWSRAQATGEGRFWVERAGRELGVYGEMGGKSHGLWQAKLVTVGEEQEVRRTRLSRWFAVRSGLTVWADDPEDRERWAFDVTVYAAGHDPVTVTGLTAAESLNPERIMEACHSVPLTLAGRGTASWVAVKNCLSAVGIADRATHQIFDHTGWVNTPGGVAFAAPAGSVAADGIVRLEVVGRGGEKLPVESERALVGWEALPQDIRHAAQAIGGFLKLTPNRPEIGVAVLGSVFAPLTSAPEGAAVVIAGKPDTGKSRLIKMANSFLSGDGDKCLVDVRHSSEVGAKLVAGWAQNLCISFDDYRLDPDRPQTKKCYAAAIQLPYGAVGEAKGTISGGLQNRVIPHCSTLVSAEFTSGEAALESRAIIVNIQREDIAIETGYLDDYRLEFVESGETNRLTAHVLRWLAQQVESGEAWAPDGTLKSLRQTARMRRAERMQRHIHDRRAAETTASVMLGWELLFSWAEAHCVSDLLPTREYIDEQVGRLRAGARIAARRSDDGFVLVQAMVEAVEARHAFLTDAEGNAPAGLESACGWTKVNSWLSGDMWEHPRTEPLGYVLSDGEFVVIPPASLKKLVRRLNLPVAEQALHRAMGPMLADIIDTSPTSEYAVRQQCPRVPRTILPPGMTQPRGWVLPGEVFRLV